MAISKDLLLIFQATWRALDPSPVAKNSFAALYSMVVRAAAANALGPNFATKCRLYSYSHGSLYSSIPAMVGLAVWSWDRTSSRRRGAAIIIGGRERRWSDAVSSACDEDAARLSVSVLIASRFSRVMPPGFELWTTCGHQ